jgi:DNA repair protein RadC
MKTIKKFEVKTRRVALEEECFQVVSRISCSRDVAKIATSLLGEEDNEVFMVLLLDTKNRVLGYTEAARGGVSSCAVTMANIFQAALIVNCTSIIAIHNHPSGDVVPSYEDTAFTTKLEEVSQLVGIKLLDHLIVPSCVAEDEGAYFSYLDTGLLKKD